MSSIFVPHQQCPACHGALNREHCSRQWNPDRTEAIERLYCEHCNRGWETICDVIDGVMVPDSASTLDYSPRTEPATFERFLKALTEQLEVAA